MRLEIGQHNFARGELAPNILGNTDAREYRQGLAKAENWIVDHRGGLISRPGTRLIHVLPSGIEDCKLFEFQFARDALNTYLLIVTTDGIFFLRDGAIVTQRDPEAEDEGSFAPFKISVDNFFPDNASERQTEFLRDLRMTQILDYVRFTHPEFAPFDIVRGPDTGDGNPHNNWTARKVEFATRPPGATGLRLSEVQAGDDEDRGVSYLYAVGVVDADGKESDPSFLFINNAPFVEDSPGSVIKLRWAKSSAAKGYRVYKSRPVRADNSTGRFIQSDEPLGLCATVLATNFADTGHAADFSVSPARHRNPFAVGAVGQTTITNPGGGYTIANSLSVETPEGGRAPMGLPIVTGAGSGIEAIEWFDAGEMVDGGEESKEITISGPPGDGNFRGSVTFSGTGEYPHPHCSAVFQQRLFYASSNEHPLRVFGSRTGHFDDFSLSDAAEDNGSVEFDLDSDKFSNILHMVAVRDQMLLFSETGIWSLRGNEGNVVTPTNAKAGFLLTSGSTHLRPVLVDDYLVYIAAEGNDPRILLFTNEGGGWQDRPLSHFSNHLFGQPIRAMSFARAPQKLLWMVREDGVAIAMAIDTENQLYAATPQTTRGKFVSVQTLRGPNKDTTYFAVRRTRGVGDTSEEVLMIEELQEHDYSDPNNSWCLDSAVEITSNDFTISVRNDTVYVLVYLYAEENIGIRDIDNSVVYSNGEAHSYGMIPGTQRRGFPISLDESSAIAAQQDGTFPRIVVGLPYTCIAQTLSPVIPPNASIPPIEVKQKQVSSVGLHLYNTIELKVSHSNKASVVFKPPSIVEPGRFSDRFDLGFATIKQVSSKDFTTGPQILSIPTGSEIFFSLQFVNDSPTPAGILSYFLSVDTEDVVR